MNIPAINLQDQSVTADIRTRDGEVINIKVQVPSDGSLAAEELLEAALIMIQPTYPGAKWVDQ